MKIRAATAIDSQRISELSMQLGYDADATSILARIQITLKRPDHFLLVAESAGIVVGWMHCFDSFRIESEAFLEIGGLVVDQDCRGKGIGKSLLQHAILTAQNQNYNKLRVRSNSVRKRSH